MDKTTSGAEPREIAKLARQGNASAGSGTTTRGLKFDQVTWLVAGIVLAAVSYVWVTRNHSPHATSSLANSHLPESYAVCTETGKIYTVDETSPNVDCILVIRGNIASTGGLGTCRALPVLRVSTTDVYF